MQRCSPSSTARACPLRWDNDAAPPRLSLALVLGAPYESRGPSHSSGDSHKAKAPPTSKTKRPFKIGPRRVFKIVSNLLPQFQSLTKAPVGIGLFAFGLWGAATAVRIRDKGQNRAFEWPTWTASSEGNPKSPVPRTFRGAVQGWADFQTSRRLPNPNHGPKSSEAYRQRGLSGVFVGSARLRVREDAESQDAPSHKIRL
ncbi:hypothetical protein M885DRAFT_523013 [Pelagophyceae sp. CCMP2097]|nr:hypothetical protein M885DRAFT_523013 [Pelagophyceae sp. CCMP2097]|mmetsp:Transcript_1254/g.3902  ORF Transcript_1254/g.3902 Transcript_1254/m.3902 type:complete len:200 (+) Transcript_1254:1037-1636(+)